jgi:hypothetical protein
MDRSSRRGWWGYQELEYQDHDHVVHWSESLDDLADCYQAAFAVEFLDACFQLMRLWGGLRAIQVVSYLMKGN